MVTFLLCRWYDDYQGYDKLLMHFIMTQGFLQGRVRQLAATMLADTSEPFGFGTKVVLELSEAEVLSIKQKGPEEGKESKKRKKAAALHDAARSAPGIALSLILGGKARGRGGSTAVAVKLRLPLARAWSKGDNGVVRVHTQVSNEHCSVGGWAGVEKLEQGLDPCRQ